MDEKEIDSCIHIPNIELFICVKYYIAVKKYKQALAVLINSSSREAHEQFLFGELTFSLLRALAWLEIGDPENAIKDFRRAYQLAFDGEFEMPFIELGTSLRPLITTARKADCSIPIEWLKMIGLKAAVYAKKLQYVQSEFNKEQAMENPVRLSRRERQILNDIYLGLTREKISATRYITVNTVKTITQSLYNKLDVTSKADAIRKALDWNLIEPGC